MRMVFCQMMIRRLGIELLVIRKQYHLEDDTLYYVAADKALQQS